METRTDSLFGRHAEKLVLLEEILKGQNLREHKALIVGAGLDFPAPYVLSMAETVKQSWEYVELGLMLQRLGKPWQLTIADKSPEVCNAVSAQKSITVDDLHLQTEPLRQYFKTVLAGMDELRAMPEEELKMLAECAARYTKTLTEMYEAKIPATIRENISVVQRDLTNLPAWQQDANKYDIIMCQFVMKWLYPEERQKARRVINTVLAPGGILFLGDRKQDSSENGIGLPEITREEILKYPNHFLVSGIYQKPI